MLVLSTDLQLHINRFHLKIDLLKCDFEGCEDKEFYTDREKITHMARVHDEISAELLTKCDLCDKIMPKQSIYVSNLQLHIEL